MKEIVIKKIASYQKFFSILVYRFFVASLTNQKQQYLEYLMFERELLKPLYERMLPEERYHFYQALLGLYCGTVSELEIFFDMFPNSLPFLHHILCEHPFSKQIAWWESDRYCDQAYQYELVADLQEDSSLLIESAKAGALDEIYFLLSRYPRPHALVAWQDSTGKTVFHHAAAAGQLSALAYLLPLFPEQAEICDFSGRSFNDVLCDVASEQINAICYPQELIYLYEDYAPYLNRLCKEKLKSLCYDRLLKILTDYAQQGLCGPDGLFSWWNSIKKIVPYGVAGEYHGVCESLTRANFSRMFEQGVVSYEINSLFDIPRLVAYYQRWNVCLPEIKQQERFKFLCENKAKEIFVEYKKVGYLAEMLLPILKELKTLFSNDSIFVNWCMREEIKINSQSSYACSRFSFHPIAAVSSEATVKSNRRQLAMR